MIKLTIFFVPALIILAIVSAIVKKKNAYSAFIQGSKECSDIVKVDSQKELTQSTFLFFIL